MVDHPSVAYLRRLFGETTEGPIFLCSLPNDKGKGDGGVKTRHCVGPNCAQQIYSFVNHHDQIGRGTYYTMSTVKEGLQRCKDNCLETPALVIDLDFKSVEAAPAHCENIVPALFCPPTGIIRSGFGLHVVWQLKEALPTQENLERIESVLRQLADVIGGDLAVCHPPCYVCPVPIIPRRVIDGKSWSRHGVDVSTKLTIWKIGYLYKALLSKGKFRKVRLGFWRVVFNPILVLRTSWERTVQEQMLTRILLSPLASSYRWMLRNVLPR